MDDLKHKIYTSSECLSEQTMFDYIDGKLNAKEQHAVEKYMLECDLCSDAMEGLSQVKNRKILSEINHSISESIALQNDKAGFDYRWLWSVAAGILLLLGGVFLFNQFNASKKERMADLKVNEVKNKPSVTEDTVTFPSSASSAPVAPAEKNFEQVITKNENQTTETSSEVEALKQQSDRPDEPLQTIAQDEVNDISVISKDKDKSPQSDSKTSPSLSGNTNAIASGADVGAAAPVMEEGNAPKATGVAKDDKLSEAGAAEKADDNGYFALESTKFQNKKSAKSAEKKKEEQKETGDRLSTQGTFEIAADRDEEQDKAAPSYSWSAQNDSTNFKEHVYTIVDEMPVFPGGEKGLDKYINDQLQGGNFRNQNGEELLVTVQFIITAEGKAIQPKFLSAVNKETEAKLLKIIIAMPLWNPGKLNGKQVPVYRTLSFKINK